jgi:hypothetical protein
VKILQWAHTSCYLLIRLSYCDSKIGWETVDATMLRFYSVNGLPESLK